MTVSPSRWTVAVILAAVMVLLLFKHWNSWEEAKDPTPSTQERSETASNHQHGKEQSAREISPVSGEEASTLAWIGVAASEKRGGPEVSNTSVEIQIVDEEGREPIPGATVSVLDYRIREEKRFPDSDSDGKISLDLDFGRYRITATHPEYTGATLMIGADAETPSISRTIELARVQLVRGVVRNQDGHGVSDAWVSFGCKACPEERSAKRFSAKTGPEGLFEIEVADGVYWAKAGKLMHHSEAKEGIRVPAAEPVELSLVEERELVKLSGRVTDEEQQAVAGANVSVRVNNHHQRWWLWDD